MICPPLFTFLLLCYKQMILSYLSQYLPYLIVHSFNTIFGHGKIGVQSLAFLSIQLSLFCYVFVPILLLLSNFNEVPISSVSNCRDLGIVFSSDHSWSNHYKHISKKAYGQLLLKRTFTTTCPSVKRLLYISLVRSQITYCSPVWRPMFIMDIVTLERNQRRSTKFIVGNSLSYRDRLISLNLLPLMYFYEYLDIIFLLSASNVLMIVSIFVIILLFPPVLLTPVLLQKSLSSTPPQTDPDIFISTG